MFRLSCFQHVLNAITLSRIAMFYYITSGIFFFIITILQKQLEIGPEKNSFRKIQ